MATERRETRDAMQQSLLNSIPKDMNRPWEDPRPEPGERTVAQGLRGIGQAGYEMPEWKRLSAGVHRRRSEKRTRVDSQLRGPGSPGR